MSFPSVPEALKAIAHYLKVADEHDKRDVVISYWCRLHALDVAIKLQVQKTPEVNKLLLSIMEWLETIKSKHPDQEAINNKVCAQATVENYALKLFTYADEQDRLENYGKNVVKAFYTAGILMDVLVCFGELSEDIVEKRKYAKWKAAYIHNCLKAGERPVPGPMTNEADGSNDFTRISDPNQPTIGGFSSFYDPIANGNNVFPHPVSPGTSAGPTNWNKFSSVPQQPTDHPTTPVYPAEPYNPPPNSEPTTPFVPAPASTPTNFPSSSISSANLDADQIAKAQKYCKWASSALNYDDVKNAIENLQKALHLLQFGKEIESPA